MPGFPSIVVLAQHLAIFRVRFPALMPRLDVIAFHFLKFKFLPALHAHSFLAFVCLSLLILRERANVQMPFVAL
jgi:hypothetical protein